jgi:flagellin
MPLRVNNNIMAINARRSIDRSMGTVNRQLERLSSGLRVNRAADDASGLVVSEGMRGELSGLNQNVRNAEQASNLLQVAEGSLQEVNSILVRMRELSVQSSSSTINDSNRARK